MFEKVVVTALCHKAQCFHEESTIIKALWDYIIPFIMLVQPLHLVYRSGA